ncbi:TonB-dependent receptor [Marinicauda salina]|uniref:TonB-dependent receptor n=1 Tax=Marinicauda salina TaxID=2135793 RepID=A0A2U2BT20_9PROT|nr:TonB-dependent receptor [Marinicauda salina]PWE17120.1 TonB-dependent receptor [Marinicauda salina]
MNHHRIALSAALLASTVLVPASAAWAQEADPSASAPTQTDDVIVVRYQYVPDDKRATSEVSSFLSIDDIVTTGDSDIASALGRVTGLSVSEGRYVVVRGLNERYSNTLINGSPLASPEPLRRAVPLDLFPTSLISNTLVQKTYSPRFPGEFGGGLVEIETSALPEERFLEVGVSFAADTITSFDEGLTYDGGDDDWTGFEDGTRDWPAQFADILLTENIGPSEQDPVELAEIGRNLENSRLWVQFEEQIPGDAGFSLSAGDRFDFDNFSVGVLAAVGYDNSWQTEIGRRGKARVSSGGLTPRSQFARTSTANTVETNGMFNLGVEFGEHEVQALALVLRSTEKETSSLLGRDDDLDSLVRNDANAWFERQVYTYQLSGDHTFDLGEGLNVEWRAATSDASRYAPNQRRAFYEFDGDESAIGDNFELLGDSRYAGDFLLRNSGDGNTITFSRVDDVTDDIGFDVTLPVTLGGMDWEWSAGYNRMDKERVAFAREFRFFGSIPADLRGSRIDYIFADQNILDSRFRLTEVGGSLSPEAYRGDLEVEAGYISTDVALTPFLRAAAGVRFEDGEQTVDTYNLPILDASDFGDNEGFISEDYALPAVTLTWTFAENMQLRLGYSETIARPQFRELGPTTFFNTETDERFRGNPFLTNTEITNFDARFEWYFGRDQFFTAGLFYKELESPVVEYILREGETLATSFLNAPSAELTGFEVEFEKRFDFSDRFEAAFWDDAEVFVKANYTFTDSSMAAGDGDTVILSEPAGGEAVAATAPASGFIADGQTLQGQSEHLANLQIGWEEPAAGRRTAFLVNFTGERTRALQNLAVGLPEVVEEPPVMLDFVHSRELEFRGREIANVRFAVRNLLGEDYVATQSAGNSSIEVDSYEIGTTFSINLSRTF